MRYPMLWSAALAVLPGAASEGMLDATLYYCNATVANEAVVSACAASHPGLATQAQAALASWQGSYGAKAQGAKSECAKRLSDAESKAFHDEALRRWLNDIEIRAKDPDDAYCRRAISKIGDVSEDRGHWPKRGDQFDSDTQ